MEIRANKFRVTVKISGHKRQNCEIKSFVIMIKRSVCYYFKKRFCVCVITETGVCVCVIVSGADLEVAVNGHHRHERDAGRAVGEHQEEVDAAHGVSKHPVAPEQGIDPERQTDQRQEVSDDQVKEKQRVRVPALQFEAEDPQGHDISQQPQGHVDGEDRGQNQTLQLDPHGGASPWPPSTTGTTGTAAGRRGRPIQRRQVCARL